VSDLGNGVWPNSMKLGEGIDLEELLQEHTLVDFVRGYLQFSREGGGVPIRVHNQQKKPPV